MDDEELSDVDSISTTSTAVAESYIIDKILADRKTHNGKQWLVSWAGYDLSECTWEPRSSFNDDFGLEEWKIRKKRGEAPSPARIKEIEVLMNQRILAKNDRSRRRAAKRKRLAAKRKKLLQASRTTSYDKSSPKKKRRRLVQRASSKAVTIDSDHSADEVDRGSNSDFARRPVGNAVATISKHAADGDDSDVLPAKKLSDSGSFSRLQSPPQPDPNNDDYDFPQANQHSEQGARSLPSSPGGSDLVDIPLESYGSIVAQLLTSIPEHATPDKSPGHATTNVITEVLADGTQSSAGASNADERGSVNSESTMLFASTAVGAEKIPANPVQDELSEVGTEIGTNAEKPTNHATLKSTAHAHRNTAAGWTQSEIPADDSPLALIGDQQSNLSAVPDHVIWSGQAVVKSPVEDLDREQTQAMDEDTQDFRHTSNAMDEDGDEYDNHHTVKAVKTNGHRPKPITDAQSSVTSAKDYDAARGSMFGSDAESTRRRSHSHGPFIMDESSDDESRDSGEVSETGPVRRDSDSGQSSVHPDTTKPGQQPRPVRTTSIPGNDPKPTFKPIAMTSNAAKVRSRSIVDGTTVKQPTGPLFKNLSTENRFKKYGRENERAPDADSLTFVDAKTGQTTTSVFRRDLSPTLTGPQRDSSLPRRLSQPSETEQDETRPVRVPEKENVEDDRNSSASLSTVQSRNQISIPSHAEKTNPDWVRQNVECRLWLKHGSCKFGDSCRFAHHYCELLQPKEPRVCSFWQKGKCHLPVWQCLYHHGFQDPITGEFPDKDQNRRPHVDTSSEDGLKENASNNSAWSKWVSRKDITCRYWLLGTCRETATGCKFAHEQRDQVVSKRKRTCKSWLAGRCPHSDAFCAFYHCRPNSNDEEDFGIRNFRTCEAWKAGRCLLAEDKCPAYHCFWSRNADGIRNSADDDQHIESEDPPVDTITLPAVNITWSNGSEFVVSYLIQEGRPGIPPRSRIAIRADCPSGKHPALVNSSQQPVSRGMIYRGPIARDNMQFDNWVAYLEENDLDAVGTLDGAIVVISSAKPSASANIGLNTFLTFSIFEQNTLVSADVSPEVTLQKTSENDMFRAWAKFDIDHIFAQYKGKPSKKIVFLMIPNAYEAEIYALSRYLKLNQVTVFLPDSTSAWDEFIRAHKDPKLEGERGGCVLWHPSVSNYWQVPKMLFALWRSNINFFRLDVFDPIDEIRSTCTRIFPRGLALLVTDDAIIHEAHYTLDLIEHFHRGVFQTPTCDRKNRLFFRPGILDFVMGLGLAATDNSKKELYFRMTQLLHDLLRPWTHPKDPAPFDAEPLIVSSDEGTNYPLVEYASSWGEHPKRATYLLVQVFVLWSLTQVEDLRRFGVIVPLRVKHPNHEDSDSDMEDSEPDAYVPRSPATPKTPRRDSSPSRRHSNASTGHRTDRDARISFWAKKYQHVWFLSAERWMQDQKDSKKEAKSSK
ncbi:hypothetical protein K461DRAFT_318808 [Myriangium duriaei CBS 260.36]|uniref:Chromo domain-containing protein n=1 Tax=Myriangium duriaei CBS 260.36 TaxID=1168546 RepID=A0A9P4JA25_9PEZI|nr:hypothetical protein K461DRAFT_318808 [Myriangium duriaei CBS 260.36]